MENMHRANGPFIMLLLALLVLANFNASIICEKLLRVINFEKNKFNEHMLSFCELLPEMQKVRSFL